MSFAAGRIFHDYRCAATCNAASGRAGETVDRCAGCATPDWRPSKTAFNRCGSDDNASPRNDPVSDDPSTDGRWPVLNRSASQGPVPRRHGRMGKPRFQGLSFCRDAELRDDQERRVYVRTRRHGGGVPSGQEREAPLIFGPCVKPRADPRHVRPLHSKIHLVRALPALPAHAAGTRPRYNICPTDPVDVVIRGDVGLLVVPMRWQLIPPWWKKPLKELPATFNARAETVAEKPMFRDAFRRTRCLIPASGYYEWQTTPDGKQPYYITSTNGPMLTIAGLWSEWRDRVNDETLTTCTMIITPAGAFAEIGRQRLVNVRYESRYRPKSDAAPSPRSARNRQYRKSDRHSITSSARCWRCKGTSRPSVLAVLRLITSSNLVGACTGRSAGLAPLKMRSTYEAERRKISEASGP